MTMTLIETLQVPGGGASIIEFSNIPQDGTDLICFLSARGSDFSNVTQNNLTVNNVTTASYSERRVSGDGFGSRSDATTNQTSLFSIFVTGNGATANVFGSVRIYIPNYALTQRKNFSIDAVSANAGGNAGYMGAIGGRFSGTAAITSLQFRNLTANYLQNTTASLYKITKA